MVATETKQAVTTVTTVDTKEFTRELEWAARFVDGKITVPILHNVALRSVKGSLQLIATDLETSGITTVPASGEDFAVTVPAQQALKYLRKVSESSLTLSVDGNNLVIRHGEDSEATINGLAMDSFPELPAFPKDRFMLKGLESALPRVICSISAEESRFTLNGALLAIDAKRAHFVSTGGHRMSIVPIKPSSRKDFKALIPRFALSEVHRLGEDAMLFGADEKHVTFVGSRRVVMARKLTGNFPDYERVIPRDLPHTATVDADALRKHGERVALFADSRSHGVRLTLADNKLTVSASISGSGKAKASVATTWERPEWSCGFNWEYILDFLKLAPKTAFDLNFAPVVDEKQPKAVTLTVSGWTYVVMPMRM